MKILVCIKQVPDPDSRFRPNAGGTWIDETDTAFRINEYDEYAVEQALRLKEQLDGDTGVTVLSVGPDRVRDVILKALAMGCDAGVHIRDAEASLKDPWQIAGIIAGYAGDKGFDLIFTGMQSQDRGSAQVGSILAELLGYACITTIVGFACENGSITVKKELEGGSRGVARVRPPALFTCQSGLNTPRYPTLPNILKAKKKEIETVPLSDLPVVEPLTITTRFYLPGGKGKALLLEGDVEVIADRLMEIMQGKYER